MLRSIEILISWPLVLNVHLIDYMSVSYGMPRRVAFISMLSFFRCQVSVETLFSSNQCATTDNNGLSLTVHLDKRPSASLQTRPFSATAACDWIGAIALAINRHRIDKQAFIEMLNGTDLRNDSHKILTLKTYHQTVKNYVFLHFKWLSASNKPVIKANGWSELPHQQSVQGQFWRLFFWRASSCY